MDISNVFATFGGGMDSAASAASNKLYTGVGLVKILDVNPPKEKLEEYLKRTISKDVNYVSEKEGVKNVRLCFVVSTVPEACGGIELTTTYNLFLRDSIGKKSQSGKVQVIDNYGNTSWVTDEQYNSKLAPEKSMIIGDYRLAYPGEGDLLSFLKAFLCIPSSVRYVDKKWVASENISDCYAKLEKVPHYFTGDVTEIREVMRIRPENRVKLLFGVRVTAQGSMQSFFTEYPMMERFNNYDYLVKKLNESKSSGRYRDTEFVVDAIHEYVPTHTSFTSESSLPPISESSIQNWISGTGETTVTPPW